MTDHPSPHKPGRGGLFSRIAGLWHDRTGVGAVEFALIAPLLLMIYITTFELTIGLSISKRVTKAAGTIADLVSQRESTVDPAFLSTMADVAGSILVPYNGGDISLRVTGIEMDGSNPKTDWSWTRPGVAAPPAGGAIPKDMKVPGSFLIHAEVSIPHELLMVLPGLLPSEVREITIRRDYYFHTRSGTPITCSGC